jgi:hypothetical protein
VTKRDPHGILGVEPGASPTMIKAAWRSLARTHHPDLTGDDPEASRVATQRMAEINDAYAALTRDGGRLGKRWAGNAAGAETGADAPVAPGSRGTGRGGPPRPKPTRPVTARVDTSHTVRPRNQPIRSANGDGADDGPLLRGQSPFRVYVPREPPRSSIPTGPMARSVARDFRQPPMPDLADALVTELPFGKFHGHTLGQVASFEPSYIDWLATTITRDRDLVAAARVVRDDLDRRGVSRRVRQNGTSAGHGQGL